ncbi:MAG: hypothetical protein HY816_08055 [Candidatus Wallbacteria bacterium]|nr:hypothetical protein [Candidatus Wallbacteria bacterium]
MTVGLTFTRFSTRRTLAMACAGGAFAAALVAQDGWTLAGLSGRLLASPGMLSAREREIVQAGEMITAPGTGGGRLCIVPLGAGSSAIFELKDGEAPRRMAAGVRLRSVAATARFDGRRVELEAHLTIECAAVGVPARRALAWQPPGTVTGVSLMDGSRAVPVEPLPAAGLLVFELNAWTGTRTLRLAASFEEEDEPDPADRFAAWLPWDLDPAFPERAELSIAWKERPAGIPVEGNVQGEDLVFSSGPRSRRPAWGYLPGRFETAADDRLTVSAPAGLQATRGAGFDKLSLSGSGGGPPPNTAHPELVEGCPSAQSPSRAAAALPWARRVLAALESELGPVGDGARVDVAAAGSGRTVGRTVIVRELPAGSASPNDWSPDGCLFQLAHELAHLAWPATGGHDSLSEGLAQVAAWRVAARLGGVARGQAVLEHWRELTAAKGLDGARTVGGRLARLTDPFRTHGPGDPVIEAIYAAQPLALLERWESLRRARFSAGEQAALARELLGDPHADGGAR